MAISRSVGMGALWEAIGPVVATLGRLSWFVEKERNWRSSSSCCCVIDSIACRGRFITVEDSRLCVLAAPSEDAMRDDAGLEALRRAALTTVFANMLNSTPLLFFLWFLSTKLRSNTAVVARILQVMDDLPL